MPSIFIFFGLLLILLLAPTFNSAIETEYIIGETLKLDLSGKEAIKIALTGPRESLIIKPDGSFFVYTFETAGNYTLEIRSQTTKEIHQLQVRDPEQEKFVFVDIDKVNRSDVETPNTTNHHEQTQPGQLAEKIRVGKRARWVKRSYYGPTESLEIGLPVTAEIESVQINKDIISPENQEPEQIQEAINYSLDTRVTESEASYTAEKILGLQNISESFEIIYSTPGPQKKEEKTAADQKVVTIYSAEEGYRNVRAFTDIEEKIPAHKKELIEIYWQEGKRIMEFEAFDHDTDGFIDSVEWDVPHLSNQSFNVSIKVLNVQSYPIVGGNWTVEFVTIGEEDLFIRAINGTTMDPAGGEVDLEFLEVRCGNETLPTLWSPTRKEVRVRNYQCNESGFEISKVHTPGKHYLEFEFGDKFAYAQNDATDPEYRVFGEWGTVTNLQEGSWTNISFNYTYNSTPVVIHYVDADYTYTDNPCQTRIRNVNTTGFQIRAESWSDSASCPSTGVNGYWLAAEQGIHNLTNFGAVVRTIEVQNFTMSSSACGSGAGPTDWTFTANHRLFTNSWSTQPFVFGAVQSANDLDVIHHYIRGCDNTNGNSWNTTCVEIGMNGMENDGTTQPCTLHTVDEEGGLIAWESNAAWTNAETLDNNGVISDGVRSYAWEAYWESDNVRGSQNDPAPIGSYSVTLSTTFSQGAAFSSGMEIDGGNGLFPVLDFDAGGNTVYFLADEDQFGDAEQAHGTEPWQLIFFNDSSGFLFENISLDDAPPRYSEVAANNTNPGELETVQFHSNWTDPGVLVSWTFYWDYGGPFVPAGSGTFSGTDDVATIDKQIPAGTEGTDIQYYFRAVDFYNKDNQTDPQTITVQDISAPTFNTRNVTPSQTPYGTNVTFTANITDTTNVSQVWIQITRPDFTQENVSLAPTTGDLYEANYTSLQIGLYNGTLFANDTLGNLGNDSNILYWNATGYANVSIEYPQTGNSFAAFSPITIECRVRDANTTSGIENYPVTFYADGTEIGTNNTNSSGIATYDWTVNGPSNTTLNCTIADNSTLLYSANYAVDSASITILVPEITLINSSHENAVQSTSSWYSNSWSNRKAIEFDGNLIDQAFFDYPMMINITDSDLLAGAQTDGDDILFTAGDGTTKLAHEIEIYNSTSGYLLAWVRADFSGISNTTIYLYYNNSVATNQENITGTWKGDYGIVYHMDLTGTDSTANARNRIADTGTPTDDDTILGEGVSFDGVSDAWSQQDLAYWEAGYDVRMNEVFFRTSSNITGRQVLFAEGGGVNGIMMYILNGRLFARWWSEGGTTNWGGDAINTTITANTNYHATMGYAEGTAEDNYFLLVNGVLIDSRTAPDTIDAHSGDGGIAYTGLTSKDFEDATGITGAYFNGTIVEFRALDSFQSYNWFNQSYKSFLGTTQYNLGTEELSTGTTNGTLNAYETLDNIAWVNATVENIGQANSSSVNVTLRLLYPNGSVVSWLGPETQSCGTVLVGETCTVQFNNSGSGFTISDNTGGLYQFNFTSEWSDGGTGNQNNQTDVRIYHSPNNFTGALTDPEITAGQETGYSFNFSNPWQDTITDLNITLHCPDVAGLFCSCIDDQNSNSCFVGSVYANETGSALFNISTNSTVAIGAYDINVTVSYTNPTNDSKNWVEYENDILQIRPLLAAIFSNPLNITRGSSGSDIRGYAKNIGTGPLSDVNLSWTIPFGWTNATGLLFNETPTLGPDELFWSNITIDVNLSATLGPQTVTLTTDSPNATFATDEVTIDIYANTSLLDTLSNNTSPLRGETVQLSALLTYDNSTPIVGELVYFREGENGTTNASGYAITNYTIPLDADLGTNNFTINASYLGSSSIYTLASTNSSTISVQDNIGISFENLQSLEGFGRNITIRANVTSTNNVSSVYVNVSTPNNNTYFEPLNLTTGDTYEINFSNTWERGTYTYGIWANNTQGFENETALSGTFDIESNFTIEIETVETFYLPNQIVNLTNGTEPSFAENSVQAEHGIIVTTGTSQTETLTNTYALNKSFIVANSNVRASTSAQPDRRIGRVYFSSISNGLSSELTAERGSTTDTMIATYSILQSDNIDACHISQTMAAADGNDDVSLASCDVGLPSDYASKCFVSTRHNVQAGTSTSGCTEEQRVMANITSTTNLNLQRSAVSCGASVVEAQVVCFNDDTTVTQLQVGPSQFSTGATSGIGHSVNLSNSWLIYSCQSDGNGIEQANIECYFSTDSEVLCRTSSLGSTETSTQECIAHVIEFPDEVNSAATEHVPTDAEVGDVTQFNSTIASAVNLSRTLGFCVDSFRSGEGTAYPRGEYPCYLQNSTSLYCERGRTGNTDPSNDLHCPIVEWPTLVPGTRNLSFFSNDGTTTTAPYYLMTVEHNGSGSWTYADTVLNDTASQNQRSVANSETVNASPIWNGPGEGSGWNTSSNTGGYYRARFDLVDPLGNILENIGGGNSSSTYEFFLDRFAPEVNLTFPANNSINFGISITVNYTATDPSGVDSCSLFHNKSGLFTLEDSKSHIEGIENQFTITDFTENTYIRWNVRCNDSVGNQDFTATDGYFSQVVPADFQINSSAIVFDNQSTIIEGANVTINATVWNLGGQEGTAEVEFYLGDPEAGGTYIDNDSVTVPVGGSQTAQINWSAIVGPNNIFVLVDPPIATNGTTQEINESNNEANQTFNIGAWQEFYGNASINIQISNAALTEIDAWGNDSILDGNIFVVDTESSVDWLSLTAMGRNTSGLASNNDFLEFDQLIGMENFTDSVSTQFTNSQIPKTTTNLTLHGYEVLNIPIINSTNTQTFQTGIAWDSSDDSTGEYDSTEQEDIIFISRFNRSSIGFYGTYDYEITIPSRLRTYNNTEQTNVYLYFDLN